MWVWGGVSVVVASAVAVGVLVGTVGDRRGVLAVTRDVPVGEVIGPRDLREVQVASEEGVVPAGQTESVVGKVAAVPLVAGSLLAPEQVGRAAAFPPEGYSEVSFAVEEGDAPEVVKGARVAVFPGPGGEAVAVEEAELVAPVVGTVTGVAGASSPGGAQVVAVLVESAAAERAVGLERPRVVVLGGGR